MSASLDIVSTPLAGLYVLQRQPLIDRRGYFERLFCADELGNILPGRTIVQINHTLTTRCGVVRGMHFQYPPHAELKIVSCLRGEVFDVAVDIRQGSSTFLESYSEIITADNHKSIVIPEGFAHGFQTLNEECELLYFHTASYQADSEGGLNVQDKKLAIQWPLSITGQSPRDLAQPMIDDDFAGVVL